ncbi:MAG: response regulator transcription factor [Rhodospirillum sp.]|nr:response regulator transcription factor [Rhodospirillum sp.]MCF8488019.1 response regulator transcription factor [Rhodospirillum sp.]MCF8500286.1 response regulator transcription factor [Rhodospirillum sp.]
MRLLLVEDQPALGPLTRDHLVAARFTVDLVTTVEEAEAALATTPYDLVILDLSLPDGDGLELVRRLRANKGTVPVLAATARDRVDQRISGLDLGLDDYLVKPYDMGELTARVRALLRRPGAAHGVALTRGDIRLDTVTMAVTVAGRPLVLGKRRVVLLESLMRAAGRVVSRQALEGALYGMDEAVAGNALEAAISRLRRALTEAGSGITLHTVRGVGYMLGEADD